MTLRRREYLVESRPMVVTASSIDRLRPTDRLILYHATYSKQFEKMAHGIDALKVVPRLFNQGKHSGLFVTPNKKTLSGFGNIVFELSLPARGLHANLGYSGGVDTRKEDDLWRDKYPRSFRPSLNAKLLDKGTEPQALYLGLVRPKDIIGVYHIDRNGKWGKRETVKAALERYGKKFLDVDVTNPRMGIRGYLDVLGKGHGMKLSEKQLVDAVKWYKPSTLEDVVGVIMYDLGGPEIGERAAQSVARDLSRKLGISK